MRLAEIYARAVKKQLNAIANWEPGTARKVGDYGIIEDGVFKYQGHVSSALNCRLDIADEAVTEIVNYNSDGTHVVPIELGAAVGPDGTPWIKAALALRFSGTEAIALNMVLATRSRLVNTDALAYEIKRKFESDQWPQERVVVLEATTAASGFILVAASGHTEFQFEADVSRLEELNLAHPKLKIAPTSDSKQHLHWKISNPATPLLRVGKLSRKWFLGQLNFRSLEEAPEEQHFYSQQALAAEKMAQRQNTFGSALEERLILEEYLGD